MPISETILPTASLGENLVTIINAVKNSGEFFKK